MTIGFINRINFIEVLDVCESLLTYFRARRDTTEYSVGT